nr:hypothetical protein [Crucivirus sp.]
MTFMLLQRLPMYQCNALAVLILIFSLLFKLILSFNCVGETYDITVVLSSLAAGNISSDIVGTGESPSGTFSNFTGAHNTQYALWGATLTCIGHHTLLTMTCTVGALVHSHVFIQQCPTF